MRKILILILLITAIQAGYTQDKVVYLFDNSGSMSGYYREANSAFKIFSTALIKNTTKPENEIEVMLFFKTESARGMESPKSLYKGSGSGVQLDKIKNDFQLTRGKDGDFGNTDLIEALDDGIASLDGEKGIIWLITDNINDTGVDDSSYMNTLRFYERLRNDAKIQKILLYPVPETIVEEGIQSKGYVVYGIVYSPTAIPQAELEAYDVKLRASGIKQKPITLKPLDIGTIVLKAKVTQSKITGGKLYFDGKTLRGFDFEEGQPVKEIFNDLSLKSNLYPYRIRSAKLSVRLEDFSSSDYSVKSLGTQTITPSTVSNVSPEGEVTGFTVTFNMPEISPNFSFNTIFKEDFTVGGNLVLEVSDVDIVLDEAYMSQFNQLFALESVPGIFRPVLKDKKINTEIPLEIRILYGPWRMFVLIGLIALVVLIIAGLLYIAYKKKCFTLKINNEDEQGVCLNMFSSYSVTEGYSPDLGRIKKSITGALTFKYSKFTTTPGRTINLVEGIPVEIEYEDSDLQSRKVILTVTAESVSEKHDADFDSGLSEYH